MLRMVFILLIVILIIGIGALGTRDIPPPTAPVTKTIDHEALLD